ncbi:MAG: DNA polymerase/3'-5' exonuclease PolX [Candidatus Omnitrophica bacterium]|nr:DNA polymerase/3'-5' exonuclease PolX [Candidatus Omnitrophota bacterium]
MDQREIAEVFEQIADLLELKGENPFRIQAYRRAALNLKNLSEDLRLLAETNGLERIPGIGKDLSAKILEMLQTGKLRYLDELKKQVPASLAELLTIPGVGPKTARLVYDRFHAKSIDDLERLARTGKLRAIPGFQAKKEENILRGVALVKTGKERMPLGEAMEAAEEVLKGIKTLKGIKRLSVAGSLRRCKETVRDLDILIASPQPEKVMDGFVRLPFVAAVQAQGETKSSIRTRQGIQVDLRVVPLDSFGAALLYFTGSKEHNIRLRSLANRSGLTINEYGIFHEKDGKKFAGREEEEIYEVLGLSWIPPELREDRGEIEAARKGLLPQLVDAKDIEGSFHNHSTWSDGRHSIEEIAGAVRKQGYRYMILSDHSQSLRIAKGLSEARILAQLKEVGALNRRLKPFRILTGSEVDILPDGRLDYPDAVLKKLDVVIAAVHSAFKQPKEMMTRRIVKAVRNRYVSILAHPTGRLLGERDPYALDMEAVFREAARTGTAMEINCCTVRMDLNDVYARQAKECGAKLVISTDTHALEQLGTLKLGVAMARRAWVGPKDILNSMGADELLRWVARKRDVTAEKT